MGDAAAMLSDDVVREILVYVKEVPAALFRCAMACKRWRGLVADLSFLRRCWPPEHAFIGFVTRGQLHEKGTKELVPTPGSALGRGLRALSSFVPALPAGAVPLASRHGLLLVRLDSGPIVAQLAVCNLHVGTCHVLPPLSSRFLVDDKLEVNCYAVLTAADCRFHDDHDKLPPPPRSHPSSFFKVLIIGKHNGKYHLHTLSSHEATWNVRIDCFKSMALYYATTEFFSNIVVGRGTARWILRDWLHQRFCVANLNTHTELFSLTKVPFSLSFVPRYYQRSQQPLVHALADGEALSLLRMKETGPLVEIWRQEGDQQNLGAGTSEWLCTRMIKLKQPGKETQKRELCLLGEKCGTLIVTDDRKRMYTADLETGRMKRMLDWPRGRHIKPDEIVLPLEVDWAAVFLSRLGTRYNKSFDVV
jgi:hypothetical protein